MIARPKSRSEGCDKRAAPRSGMIRPGQFDVDGRVHDCVVRNISKTGAKIGLANAVDGRAATGLLKIPGFGEYEAEIIWRNDAEMGLHFRHEISFEISTKNIAASVDEILNSLKNRRNPAKE